MPRHLLCVSSRVPPPPIHHTVMTAASRLIITMGMDMGIIIPLRSYTHINNNTPFSITDTDKAMAILTRAAPLMLSTRQRRPPRRTRRTSIVRDTLNSIRNLALPHFIFLSLLESLERFVCGSSYTCLSHLCHMPHATYTRIPPLHSLIFFFLKTVVVCS